MAYLRRDQAGFTLIELLVVISIIILLASLLIPALNRARQSAKVADTQTTLSSLRSALEVFQNEFGLLPPVTTLEDPTDPTSNTKYDVYINDRFLDPDYRRTGDTSELNGGENWVQVRVFRSNNGQLFDPKGRSWVWEDTDPVDDYCTAEDLLVESDTGIDLPELLYFLVMTKFVPTDAQGAAVAVFWVGRRELNLDPNNPAERIQGRDYYAKASNSSPYADLSASRIGNLDDRTDPDVDTYPEVLDSFTNPILFTLGLRTTERAELYSLGPDGRLDFVDVNGDGVWEPGVEPANDGADDDDDGLVDEKTDELAHTPELVDDIITWE